MANMYDPRTTGALPDPVSPMGLAASAAGQGLMQFGESFIKVTDRNSELEAEEIKRVALAEVDRMKTSFNQGMAIEQLDLDKAGLEEKKRATKVAERQADTAEERLVKESEARIESMKKDAALRERALDDAQARHHDSMTNEEKRIELSESDLRLRQSIAEKNWELADKELAFQKEKFGWTKSIDELKIEQADKSLNETIRQFDANQEIRQREIEILNSRLELDTLTQEQRNEIAEEKLTIEKELAALQDKRFKLDEKKEASDESYRQATLGIAQEELQLKKDEGKWKFTTQDKYGLVCVEYHPDGKCKEKKSQVIGQEIVAINLKEPELKDIRILEEGGSWLYGSPDGLKSEFVGAVKRLNTLLTKKNPTTGTEYTLQEAIEKAKELSPDVDWDDVGNAFIFKNVSAEVVIPDNITATVTPEDGGFVNTPESIPTITTKSNTAEGETSPGRKPPISLITPEASSGSLTDDANATLRGY